MWIISVAQSARNRKSNGGGKKSKAFTEEAKDHLKVYNRLHSIYEEEGVTYKTHQFLTRITKAKVRLISKPPSLGYLCDYHHYCWEYSI